MRKKPLYYFENNRLRRDENNIFSDKGCAESNLVCDVSWTFVIIGYCKCLASESDN